MRDCYDSLLNAAAATANSAYGNLLFLFLCSDKSNPANFITLLFRMVVFQFDVFLSLHLILVVLHSHFTGSNA